MDDWSVAAAWLRQRAGETDRQWVERLSGFIEQVAQEQAAPATDDPKALRIMDRVWKRWAARLDRTAGRQSDDT